MSENGWRGFINVDLNAADKKAVKKSIMSLEDSTNWLLDMAQNGYKFSVNFVLEGKTWIVSLTAKEGPNKGLTLTQRHADYFVAVAALYYSHTMKLMGDWEQAPKQLDFNW